MKMKELPAAKEERGLKKIEQGNEDLGTGLCRGGWGMLLRRKFTQAHRL